MTEKADKTQAVETAEKKAKTPKPLKNKKGGFFNFIILLFASAALGLSAYITQQSLLLRHEVSKLTTELSQLRLLDQQPIIQSLMQEITDQNQSQQKLQEEINQRFEDWQIAIEESKSLSERRKDDWLLNEASYLMRMAATRLYLANDINSSIAALTQADLRLSELHNPLYLVIRKTLANEITELQALRIPDIDGTALKIERLLNNLPSLPDAMVSQTDQQTEEENQAQGVLSSLLSTIGIKRNAGKIPTHATRDNLLFLDQLIRLELESAKQALIRFKQEDFNNHLNRAHSLIKKHYKQDNQAVIQLLGELNSIIDSAVFPELPDITRSLNLLQSKLNRYSTPKKAPEKTTDNSEPAATEAL